MTAEFLVQKSGLVGTNWITVAKGDEDKAKEIYERQLRLYSVGRFRIIDGQGNVVAEGKAAPLFSKN